MLRLKEARKRSAMTQQQVADSLGISRSSYTNIENGKRDPDTRTLRRLADLFEVSADYLLGLTDEPAPAQELFSLTLKKGAYEELTPENLEAIAQLKKWLSDLPELKKED